jgi:hypothetical protein
MTAKFVIAKFLTRFSLQGINFKAANGTDIQDIEVK